MIYLSICDLFSYSDLYSDLLLVKFSLWDCIEPADEADIIWASLTLPVVKLIYIGCYQTDNVAGAPIW